MDKEAKVKACPFCNVRPHPKHGFVYVIVFHANIAKIGRSNDPDCRTAQHARKCALPVKEGFLFAAVDAVKAEKVLLRHFRFATINSAEWFWLPKRLRKFMNAQSFTLAGETFWTNSNEDCPACARCS